MVERTTSEPSAGQPLSGAGTGHTGEPDPRTDSSPEDPRNPASKPQGTQRDQEKNMESEGQPVQLHADFSPQGNVHGRPPSWFECVDAMAWRKITPSCISSG